MVVRKKQMELRWKVMLKSSVGFFSSFCKLRRIRARKKCRLGLRKWTLLQVQRVMCQGCTLALLALSDPHQYKRDRAVKMFTTTRRASAVKALYQNVLKEVERSVRIYMTTKLPKIVQ